MSSSNVTTVVPAPDGYVVDFDHPQRRADVATFWCFGVGLFLAVLFTAQRVYVKLVVGPGWQLDDWLLSLAWVTSIATQVIIVYGFAIGIIGVHAWEISVDQFNYFLLIVWISAPIYIIAGSAAKIALLVFYRRLSPQRWFRTAVYAAIAFIASYSVGISASLVFACTPVEKSFDVSITDGSCVNSAALYIATAVANIASDVVLFVLPLPMVVVLQMPLKQKLGLVFIFSVGSATVVSSVLRAAVLPQLLNTSDMTWDIAYASMLIVLEANMIIVCGMLPTLRKFFRHVAPKLIGESTYGKHGTTPHSRAHDVDRVGLVTFGSAPSRGYAKFGACSGTEGPRDICEVVRKGEVSTTVGVGEKDSSWDLGGSAGAGAGTGTGSRQSQETLRSGDSTAPINAGEWPLAIRYTTKIEVSYDERADSR